jgi:hypothetical protein
MAEESPPIPRQHHLRERASDEFKRFIVIFLYLWVVFGLLSIHKSLVLSQSHLEYPEQAFAIVNAFVFAKVLLVGEHFQLGTRFRDKPLIIVEIPLVGGNLPCRMQKRTRSARD